jgi:hypothetical protein
MSRLSAELAAEIKEIIKAQNVIERVKISGSSFHFYTKYGRFYATKGNMKVKVPVVSVGSATNCVHKDTCPFHTDNYKDSGYPQCYACVSEPRGANSSW